jgi:hypothetical protein
MNNPGQGWCVMRSVVCFLLIFTGLCSPSFAQSAVADYRSRNFLIHTDLPKAGAEALLVKLETMLRIVSRYWGAKNRKTIECYVIDQVSNWSGSRLDANALTQAANGGGVTISQTRTLGRRSDTKAIVIAAAKRGTPLHEAVHAYCHLNFGRTGPTWYSEGMAEMGNFWVEDDPTVTAPDYVIRHLKRSRTRTLKELTDHNDRTGDGWQNYAWRWALCHLLANNPNYSARFRSLGLAMLTNRSGATFARTFGSMSSEVEFEYRFFLKHLQPGFDVGRCAWDWKTKFKTAKGSVGLVSKIKAQNGWQASRLRVKKDTTYSYSTDGKWRLSPDEDWVSADGADSAGGNDDARMMGIVLVDDQLKAPIRLGADGTFTAEHTGKLFLRCRDEWNSLGDNDGTITVTLKRAEAESACSSGPQ